MFCLESPSYSAANSDSSEPDRQCDSDIEFVSRKKGKEFSQAYNLNEDGMYSHYDYGKETVHV
jgi:hypothetical protein